VSALQGRSVEVFEETFQLLIDGRQADEEEYDDLKQGNGRRHSECVRTKLDIRISGDEVPAQDVVQENEYS
jgi:hypothetical protein